MNKNIAEEGHSGSSVLVGVIGTEASNGGLLSDSTKRGLSIMLYSQKKSLFFREVAFLYDVCFGIWYCGLTNM